MFLLRYEFVYALYVFISYFLKVSAKKCSKTFQNWLGFVNVAAGILLFYTVIDFIKTVVHMI